MKLKILFFVAFFTIFPCVKVNAIDNIINDEKYVTVGSVDVPPLNVDIVWGAMEFTLIEETNYVWKDNTKTYELEPLKYSWIANNNYINISNNSYRDIKINLTYNSLNNYVVGVFNKEKEIIKKNNSMRFELNLSGKINNEENKVIRVGSIDLLIS